MDGWMGMDGKDGWKQVDTASARRLSACQWVPERGNSW